MTTETYQTSDRYVMLLSGITSLVLGILLFTQTSASLAIIMLLVGLVWLIQGLFSMLSIFFDKSQWGWKLFGGVIGVAAGVLVFQNSEVSTAAVPAFVAILLGVFGLLIGVSALVVAFQGEGWGAGMFGAMSVLIGFLLIVNSVAGGQFLVWIVGALLVIEGMFGIPWSFIWSSISSG